MFDLLEKWIMARPLVFIGSSAEGLKYAKAIQANLEHDAETIIWSQGVFGISENSIAPLIKLLEKLDFAILVVTPDDLVASRGDSKPAPRDNVVLELGLFIGGLGLERTFMVVDRLAKPKLPSDLAGITPATFIPPQGGSWRSAVGTACTEIEEQIRKVGARNAFAIRTSGKRVVWKDGCGIGITIRNVGKTELPPFHLAVGRKLMTWYPFDRWKDGGLLPDQETTYACQIYENDEVMWSRQHFVLDSDKKPIDDSEFEMKMILDHSDKVLYRNRRMGRAFAKLIRNALSLTHGMRLGEHETEWAELDNSLPDG
jgi:hypothetical protein